ncbi:MAG: hypothetical protein QM791_03230 [Ferruginibacter sp.]
MKKTVLFLALFIVINSVKAQNVGIGVSLPTDRLQVNAAAGSNALLVQVNAVNKLRVNANGGTSIGSAVVAPANGLYVGGVTNPAGGIRSAANPISIESNNDSVEIMAGKNKIIIFANGGIRIVTANGTNGITIDAGAGDLNLKGNNVNITATNKSSTTANEIFAQGYDNINLTAVKNSATLSSQNGDVLIGDAKAKNVTVNAGSNFTLNAGANTAITTGVATSITTGTNMTVSAGVGYTTTAGSGINMTAMEGNATFLSKNADVIIGDINARKVVINAGTNLDVTAAGSSTITIGANSTITTGVNMSLTVGNGYTISTGGSMGVSVGANYTFAADGTADITTTSKYTLKPSVYELRASSIDMQATGTSRLNGATVQLNNGTKGAARLGDPILVQYTNGTGLITGASSTVFIGN